MVRGDGFIEFFFLAFSQPDFHKLWYFDRTSWRDAEVSFSD